MSFFEEHYKKIKINPPVLHFVLGSGFSLHLDQIKQLDLFQNWEEREGFAFSDAPGIPAPTVRSHSGSYRFFVHKGKNQAISFQCGRVHLYEGYPAKDVVEPVMQVKLAGTNQFVLSNISGSLKKEHGPGTVIALKDHINMTGCSPLVGAEQTDRFGKKRGLRFPDMSYTYNLNMREHITQTLINNKVKVVPGVYVGLLGPELETPAQIQWLNSSSQGMLDVVGMSTVMEAIALKQAGAKLAAFSLVSNFAAGLTSNKEVSFKEMCQQIEPYVLKILMAFFSYSEDHLTTSF